MFSITGSPGYTRRKQPVTAVPNAIAIGGIWMVTNYQLQRDASNDMSIIRFRSGCDRFLELLIEVQMPFEYTLQSNSLL